MKAQTGNSIKIMENKVQLTDGSITLRPYRLSDAEPLYEVVRESLPELLPWMPWAYPDYSLKDSRKWIESCARTWAKGKEYNFVIIDSKDGSLLGGCGLNQVRRRARFANLGYWVSSKYTGQGVATASALLVARFGFDELGFNRIEIGAAASNAASLRVAEKIGASREGIQKRKITFRDKVYDRQVFSLTPKDLENRG
jgi:RimJ/RimL family protein N-acetyltransferase